MTPNSTRSRVEEQGGNANTLLDVILHENSNVMLENSIPSNR